MRRWGLFCWILLFCVYKELFGFLKLFCIIFELDLKFFLIDEVLIRMILKVIICKIKMGCICKGKERKSFD